MISEIENVRNIANNLSVTNLEKDLECEEYSGYNFHLDNFPVKFRKAKVTPKKVGLFVTLWKRNNKKQTEPFHENDHFQFYIISVQEETNFGFFLFSKQILTDQKILSSQKAVGKRGFRVYPNWVQTNNKQAEKTQSWQRNYFISLADNRSENTEKINRILAGNY